MTDWLIIASCTNNHILTKERIVSLVLRALSLTASDTEVFDDFVSRINQHSPFLLILVATISQPTFSFLLVNNFLFDIVISSMKDVTRSRGWSTTDGCMKSTEVTINIQDH